MISTEDVLYNFSITGNKFEKGNQKNVSIQTFLMLGVCSILTDVCYFKSILYVVFIIISVLFSNLVLI